MILADTYDPQTVLSSVDDHLIPVMGFMTLCLGATFTYLVSAFRTAKAHRSYPVAFAAVAFFGIHDATFVANWDKWFNTYDHWWLKAWAVSLIFTSAIEFALVYQVYRHGRRELFPKFTQRQFGLAILGAMVGITGMWLVLRDTMDDPLFLTAFAITAWMPPVFSTMLLVGRGSMRGQTRLMEWCLLVNPIGMFGAWAWLDPYFRDPRWIFFGAVTIGWAAFNVWLVYNVFEPYEPPDDPAEEPFRATSPESRPLVRG